MKGKVLPALLLAGNLAWAAPPLKVDDITVLSPGQTVHVSGDLSEYPKGTLVGIVDANGRAEVVHGRVLGASSGATLKVLIIEEQK
ncbi:MULTISPECIES: hypothetical protein [Spongiibacter]|uniref:hypothetical protein n=1 Tax=Spongiibacter TaxID=630749 RepID=UPI0003B72348|nr:MULTISPECIES: hypothetical protein [Spongiibacter]MBI59187.1 hypothetical protein [Spongiibacter sp.]MBO6752921.1 hypothetical protein [Spongiibacter sp.]MBU71077.1 hypothetical protein [Spongiibacter sp.]|tara:strand:- start:2399 stop:2656 length:258 start_codon:yes stop_codon:yes gene_type:complete